MGVHESENARFTGADPVEGTNLRGWVRRGRIGLTGECGARHSLSVDDARSLVQWLQWAIARSDAIDGFAEKHSEPVHFTVYNAFMEALPVPPSSRALDGAM